MCNGVSCGVWRDSIDCLSAPWFNHALNSTDVNCHEIWYKHHAARDHLILSAIISKWKLCKHVSFKYDIAKYFRRLFKNIYAILTQTVFKEILWNVTIFIYFCSTIFALNDDAVSNWASIALNDCMIPNNVMEMSGRKWTRLNLTNFRYLRNLMQFHGERE
jgi:hypothetical protein